MSTKAAFRRCVVSAVSCSMAAACLQQTVAQVSAHGSIASFVISSPLRIFSAPPRPASVHCGNGFLHSRKRVLPSLRRNLVMGGTDAGYAFEEYDSKRTSFEPGQMTGLTEFTVPWPQYYCAPGLDRTGVPKLNDPEAFKAAMKFDTARFVLVWQGKNLVRPAASGEGSEAVFLSWSDVADMVEDVNSIQVCLGEERGLTFFALDVSNIKDYSPPDGTSLEQLRSVGGVLSRDEDAGLLATARGMGVWHRSSKFCSNCGSDKVAPQRAGAGRRCGSCGAGFYPRLDPSVIVLVADEADEHILLGRKAAWPDGRYSILAGFTEMGESLEETVVREIQEESGVRVLPQSIVFSASQPWPFPRSLMIGFTARAEGGGAGAALPAVEFPEDEMEDVRWFSREEVVEALRGTGEFSIPGRAALARSMISKWATGTLV